MPSRSALIYAGIGALAAELVVWAILLPWAHYRYTTGVTVGPGLWTPILILAFVGATVGLAVFAVKRALRGR